MNNFLRIKRELIVCLLFFCVSFVQGLAMAAEESKAIIKIHNVGQGNCITLQVKHEDSTHYMLIDAGSTAFSREFKLLDEMSPQHTPLHSPYKPSTSETVKKAKRLPSKEITSMSQKSPREKSAKKSAQGTIRAALGALESITGKIDIDTIVITHPDKDHYNWVSEIVKENDEVGNIILGGFPENYNKKTLIWLADKRYQGTQVFFPALSYEPIEEEVLNRIKDTKIENPTYALQAYSTSKGIINDQDELVSEEFQKAFDFGESVEIYMLSINPLHIKGKYGVIRLYDGDEDDNKESLVMKIKVGNFSVTLTGDATQATINRIIDNYGNDHGFLKTDVLLASHHGASTHGSNSKQWLNLTNPDYILISNGLSFGHPSEEAYKRFHEVVDSKFVKRHNVLVGKSIEKKEGGESFEEGILHQTKVPIFSTLTSGMITVNCMNTTIKISTEKDKDIEINQEIKPIQNETEENEIEVYIVEKEKEINYTPKKPSKKTIVTSESESLSNKGDLSEKESAIPGIDAIYDREELSNFLYYLLNQRQPPYKAAAIGNKIKEKYGDKITPQMIGRIANNSKVGGDIDYPKLWKVLTNEWWNDLEIFYRLRTLQGMCNIISYLCCI